MQLRITRGDDYSGARRLVVTVTDPAGAAVDLTGTSLRFMAKRYENDLDEDAAIAKTTSDGIELAAQTGETTGVAYIEVLAADTADLTPARYYVELEATDSIGVITLATGTLELEHDLIVGA